jgi:rubredoxin
MPFPYSQNLKVELSSKAYKIHLLPENVHAVLLKSIENKGVDYKDTWFISRNSLFSIPFKFQVESLINEDRLLITFKLHLHNLVNGVLVINLLTAFFSKFQFETYLWFVFLASVLFYALSWLIITAGIKSMTKKLFEAYAYEEHEANEVKQDSEASINFTYINPDKMICPACQAEVQKEDLFCPSCGIRLKQNAFTKPLDL